MSIDWKEHIESKPEILFGKPVIKDTRIPVDLILEKLSFGESIEELLEAYPRINREQVLACLNYHRYITNNLS
ncbi:MAG: DUF433 domain-containing protein [Bacteroidota bacterium]